MYRITAENDGEEVLIYAPTMIGEGYVITDGHFSEEINKVDKLEFTLPKNHPSRPQLHILKTDILLYEDGTTLFRGRIIQMTQTFDALIKYTCESALGYLNSLHFAYPVHLETVPVQHLFGELIATYNDIIYKGQYPYRRIAVGNITAVSPTRRLLATEDTYGTWLDAFLYYFVATWGGRLKIRYTPTEIFLDWLELPPLNGSPTNSQVLEFGSNIIDFSQYIKADDVVTDVAVEGAVVDAETNPWLRYAGHASDPDMADLYGGFIERTFRFEELTSHDECGVIAEKLLAENKLQSISIDISAVDLSMLGVGHQKLKVGETNRVISLPHGIDDNFLLNRREVDLANPENNKYIFGRSMKKLTDSMEYSKIITRV